jgi:Na+/H+ antiporter NhaD/arsenite permease-like protein
VTAEIVSTVIFILAIVLILTERLDRAIVAVAGAAAMVTAGIAMGFYDEEMAIASIDFDTLGLLFGRRAYLNTSPQPRPFDRAAGRSCCLSCWPA